MPALTGPPTDADVASAGAGAGAAGSSSDGDVADGRRGRAPTSGRLGGVVPGDAGLRWTSGAADDRASTA